MTDDPRKPAPSDADGEDLSRIYAEVSGAEPPPALDALILDAARSEVAKTSPAEVSTPPRPPLSQRAPWAMAALVVLAAMLYQVIPGEDTAVSEPIVVSMADRKLAEPAAMPNHSKELAAAPAPDLDAGIGALEKSESFSEGRIVQESAKPAETTLAEVDAEMIAPAKPAASSPAPGELVPGVPAVALADRADPALAAIQPEPREAESFTGEKKQLAESRSLQAGKTVLGAGRVGVESQATIPGVRSDDASASVMARQSAPVSASAEFADSVSAPGEAAATGQVLIFAGALAEGVFEQGPAGFDGLGVALVRQVLERAGYRPEFRMLPLSEAVAQARTGAVDGVVGIVAAEGSGPGLDFSSESITPDGLGVAFSSTRALGSLRERFDVEIRQMRASGELAELQRRHGLR